MALYAMVLILKKSDKFEWSCAHPQSLSWNHHIPEQLFSSDCKTVRFLLQYPHLVLFLSLMFNHLFIELVFLVAQGDYNNDLVTQFCVA